MKIARSVYTGVWLQFEWKGTAAVPRCMYVISMAILISISINDARKGWMHVRTYLRRIYKYHYCTVFSGHSLHVSPTESNSVQSVPFSTVGSHSSTLSSPPLQSILCTPRVPVPKRFLNNEVDVMRRRRMWWWGRTGNKRGSAYTNREMSHDITWHTLVGL